MNDQRFFDLAMKATARQTSDAERAELEAMLARQPELRPELERLQAEVRLAKEALPLVNATEATAGEFPAYARERLQSKVRQALGGLQAKQAGNEEKAAWYLGWRVWLGLAGATAAAVMLLFAVRPGEQQLVLQVAMLDVGGATRGSETNELAVLQQAWKEVSVQSFAQAGELKAWEKQWPPDAKQPVAKIIYDRAAGEIRVLGRWQGKLFEKKFVVERGLAGALKQAEEFIRRQTQGAM